MDNLFQDLNMNNDSVHLTTFPNYYKELVNEELEQKIRKSQEICSLGLSLRKREKIKVRQPLNKIIIPFRNEIEKSTLTEISEFIKSEINVKEVELVGDSSKILVKKVKPNFKVLGPKFGKDLNSVIALIKDLKSSQIQELEEKNICVFNNIEITLEDVEVYFEDIEGWQVASENGTTIAIDTNIDEKLKIIIEIENNNLIEKAIFDNIDYIKNETLATELSFKEDLTNAQELEFDDIKIKIKIFKN